MKTPTMVALIFGSAVAHTTAAQEPSFPVVIVQLAPIVEGKLALGYDTAREHLWCVTAWERSPRDRFTLITVTEVREEAKATTVDRVSISDSDCIGTNRQRLPTIHSHPGGSCQASPFDVETVLVRMAPFDGILCARRIHTWVFSAQMIAVLREMNERSIADMRH